MEDSKLSKMFRETAPRRTKTSSLSGGLREQLGMNERKLQRQRPTRETNIESSKVVNEARSRKRK